MYSTTVSDEKLGKQIALLGNRNQCRGNFLSPATNFFMTTAECVEYYRYYRKLHDLYKNCALLLLKKTFQLSMVSNNLRNLVSLKK